MAGQPWTAAHWALAARCPGQSGPWSLSEGQTRPGGWTKVSCAVAKVEQLLGVTWDTCLREEEPLGLRAARPLGLGCPPAAVWGLGWAAERVCYGFPVLPASTARSHGASAVPRAQPFWIITGALAFLPKGLP